MFFSPVRREHILEWRKTDVESQFTRSRLPFPFSDELLAQFVSLKTSLSEIFVDEAHSGPDFARSLFGNNKQALHVIFCKWTINTTAKCLNFIHISMLLSLKDI